MALVRDLLKFSKLCRLFDFTNVSNTGRLNSLCFTISARTAKHYNPKFKWHRGKKYIPIVLPHTEEFKTQTENKIKKLGIFPRYWKRRPLTLTSATEIFDPYTPPPGDGKSVTLSKGLQKLTTTPKDKITEVTAVRKIKSYDQNFNQKIFVQEAQDLYIKVHEVLMKKDEEELSQFVTERLIADMMENIRNKTIRWKFIESIEPPQYIQTRTQEVFLKANLFSQVTVRFHTKQTLAIYDRFGRLMFGSEFIPKDVLEYVVFEKHINNEYGVWRLHAKIIPEGLQPTTFTRTYRIEEDTKAEDDVIINERDPEFESEHVTSSEVILSGGAKS